MKKSNNYLFAVISFLLFIMLLTFIFRGMHHLLPKGSGMVLVAVIGILIVGRLAKGLSH